jgi:hypothetical protein
MKKIMIGLAAACSLALTACGGSQCDDIADASKHISDSTTACTSIHSAYTEPTQAEKDSCETSLKSCTSDDKKKIDDFVSCINGLGTCKAGEEQSYSLQVVGCIGKITSVSDACGAAAGG